MTAVRCLSRQTYGWEENIENKSCNTKEEIERYYFRLGIHLFLGYALGATDLHGENIVAYGEHPVIIDMETYPGYITKNSGSSTEEKAEIKIREKIMTSVLNTGILPVLTWGTGNNRVLMSAVNMHGKIRTPFKMPVVKDDKTSNIHIEYEQVEFEIKECIVRLNGEVVNSEEYTGEIIRGFRMAYTEILQNQKLRNMLKTFFQKELCNSCKCIERCRCFFYIEEEHTEHGNSGKKGKNRCSSSFIIQFSEYRLETCSTDNGWNDNTHGICSIVGCISLYISEIV